MVSHANELGLRKMLGNLMYQTRKPDETLVLVSDLELHVLAELAEDFPHATFQLRPNLEDWGHEKRAEGVELATKEWLGFFNDDDHYDTSYLEKMLASGKDADVVWCGWNLIRKPSFSLGNSTSGNYIVRSELAKKVGYASRHYEADGVFINSLRDAPGTRCVFVDELLYAHNYQP